MHKWPHIFFNPIIGNCFAAVLSGAAGVYFRPWLDRFRRKKQENLIVSGRDLRSIAKSHELLAVQLPLLAALSESMSKSLTPDNWSELLLNFYSKLLLCDCSAIYLWNKETSMLELKAYLGVKRPEQKISLTKAPLRNGGRWSSSNEPLIVLKEQCHDAKLSKVVLLWQDDEVRQSAVSKLSSAESVLGLIYFARKADAPPFDKDTIKELAKTTGAWLTTAMTFESMREQLRVDDQTHLLNKSTFLLELTDAINRSNRARNDGAQKERYATSVLYIDVDHFKLLNDSYSKAFSDTVLARIAQVIVKKTRGEDSRARIYGDEFAVLCERTTSRNAVSVGQNIRRAVEECEFTFESRVGVIKVTVSIGISSYPDHGTTAPVLLEMAQKGLQTAKIRRNDVSVVKL